MGGAGRGWGRAQRQPHLFEHFNVNFCQSVALSDVSATFSTQDREPSPVLGQGPVTDADSADLVEGTVIGEAVGILCHGATLSRSVPA